MRLQRQGAEPMQRHASSIVVDGYRRRKVLGVGTGPGQHVVDSTIDIANTVIQREMATADLPDEILTEVFSYLPTKSIGRLRILSRSWCNVLSSASFRDLHRRRANGPGQLKVFFSANDKTLEEYGPSYFYAWQPGGPLPTKLTLHKFHRPALLTRPLHGLVIISCPGTGYHVCNPSTGEALSLPDTAQPAKMTNCLYGRYVTYGLGYCSVSEEYKAVRLFSNTYEEGYTCCEVFILGGTPYWRPTARRPPPCIVDDKNLGVFLEGRLHFLCFGRIISFDLSSETFGTVEPPPNTGHASVRMTELDGCLCVYDKYIGHLYYSCHIWVMRDYPKRQRRWEQLCRIDPMAWTEFDRKQLRSSWIAPLGMYDGNNGQRRIMFDTGTCKVFALDIPNCDAPEIIFSPTSADSFLDSNKPRLGLFEESLAPME